MDGKLRNRLFELVKDKEKKEGRRVPQREIAAATGISMPTISRWMNNEVSNADARVVEQLCKYLDCDLADLLYLEPVKPDS